MNITLAIVVAAIVILITALVVITIFGSGMTSVGSIAQARSVCATQCEASCRATGQPPVTWNIATMRDMNGQPLACSGTGALCEVCSDQYGLGEGDPCGGGTGGTCRPNDQCPGAPQYDCGSGLACC